MKPDDFKPMLACPMDMSKMSKYEHYSMEVKLDGVRCIAIKDPQGKVSLWTRQGNEMTHKLRHLVEQLRGIRGSWVLDGEIGYSVADEDLTYDDQPVVIDMDFNATIRIVGSDPDVAELKQQRNYHEGRGRIDFVAFDIMHKGNYPAYRLEQEERRRGLVHLFTNQVSQPMNNVKLVTSYPRWDDSIYEYIVNRGGEGVILKNPEAAYQFGKRRANTWYKIKKFETVDARIIGYKLGEGKYRSQIGALHVAPIIESTLIDTLTWVSGMTDVERQHMTEHFPTEYKNKMCEIRHFGFVGQYKEGLRHPQFLRMRPDLDVS
jgi:DNA ligase-1